MNEDALIGSTGFIGSTLLRARTFDALFNSSNIGTMRGRRFRTVICAGARAEKWKANQAPVADRNNIEKLCSDLSTIHAERFVLISTVDVFASPIGVDELVPATDNDLQPYGANRLHLENFVAERFPAVILRLPGVYGPGLKKNAIYDFLNSNEIHQIDSRAFYQFYGVRRLNADIERALALDIGLMHLTVQPVSVADIAKSVFSREFVNEVSMHPARYDLRTRYAQAFGGDGNYVESAADVIAGLREFVAGERAGTNA